MSFDRWLLIGKHLSGLCSSSAWCLGDWLVYGESTFSGRYREAIDQTSLDYQTLRNYAWVVRRFSPSRRRDKLSFGHHAEVAALSQPEQDFWLRKAEDLGWSVKQLRGEVRTSLRERTAAGGGELAPAGCESQPGHDTIMLKVPIPADHLEACHAAASRIGLDVQEWAGLVLMRAVIRETPAVKKAVGALAFAQDG